MNGFPQEFTTQKLWITCNADKTPRIGNSVNPRFTFLELPTDSIKGFVFKESSKLVGIDLDNCVTATGLTPLARELLDILPCDAYVEYSMSQTGIHIIGSFSENLPTNWRNVSKTCEIYTKGRYFIVTGNLHEGFLPSGNLPDLSVAVRFLVDKFYPETQNLEIVPNGTLATDEDLPIIKEALSQLSPDCDYETWMRYGMGIGNSFSRTSFRKEAAKIFIDWSQRSTKFDKKAVTSVQDFFNPARSQGGLTIATLYHDVPAVLQRKKLALFDDSPSEILENPHENEDQGESEPDSKKKKLSFKLHPKQVAEEYLQKQPCFTASGKVYTAWLGKNWQVDTPTAYIKSKLDKFIFDEEFNWTIEKNGDDPKLIIHTSLHTRDVTEVCNQLERRSISLETYENRPNTWFSEEKRKEFPYTVAVQNGLLSISHGKIVSPYTSDFFNTGILPCHWDESAKAPRFLEGLRRTFGGEASEEEIQDNIDCLQLWFGYLFLTGYSEKKIAVLLGDANSGKTTLLRIMEILVGEQFYKALAVKQLDGTSTESGVGFDTHLLGGFDEFPFDTHTGKLSNILKIISGDGRMMSRPLYLPSRSIEVLMKMVFTSNTAPTFFSDPMGGLVGRFIVWNCVAIPRELKDPNYLRYLRQNELSGILAWAVKGAQRLIAGEHLRQPGGVSEELHEEFRSSTQTHLEHWLLDTFEENYEVAVTNQEIYDRLQSDLVKLECRYLKIWLEQKNWSRKSTITTIRRLIFNTVFPNSRKYVNNGTKGVRGIAPRKTGLSLLDG